MGSLGEFTAASDVMLTPEVGEPGTQGLSVDGSSSLWEYHNRGTLNGVKVAADAASLPVDNEELLLQALQLSRFPKSEVLLIGVSGDGLARYNELLEKAYRNEIVIVDETRQFIQEDHGFMLWIRYDELEYRLNPRFKFLREEEAK